MKVAARLFIAVFALLVSFDAVLATRRPVTVISLAKSASKTKYVVIFDAGSSGSRIHVYQFSSDLELVPLSPDELEFYKRIEPGLSSYASNPKAAAESLKPLLDAAYKAVPQSVQPITPMRLQATAGLRQLPGTQADSILTEVEAFLRQSTLKLDSVSILDGKDEGAFNWACVNYLLGLVGKSFYRTVGAIDLGGGSVQMAYAISQKSAANAPGKGIYLKTMHLGGKLYYVYTHSYLNYGLLAARAEILKLVTPGTACPCITSGFKGEYKYGGVNYPALSPNGGADVQKCRTLVLKALKVDHTCSYHGKQCTFGGVWNGGGGVGQRMLYVGSFFYDQARVAGILKNTSAPSEDAKPSDFIKAAKRVCSMNYKELLGKLPELDKRDVGYICMDLIYEYSLLVNGFGIAPSRKIKLAKRIVYKGFEVETSWTLGSAIDAISK